MVKVRVMEHNILEQGFSGYRTSNDVDKIVNGSLLHGAKFLFEVGGVLEFIDLSDMNSSEFFHSLGVSGLKKERTRNVFERLFK